MGDTPLHMAAGYGHLNIFKLIVRIFRNNKKVNEPYIGSKCDFYLCAEIENIKVPEGYVLVLGDNRGNSQDGRSWPGTFLPKEEIIGRAYFRFWPFERLGFF